MSENWLASRVSPSKAYRDIGVAIAYGISYRDIAILTLISEQNVIQKVKFDPCSTVFLQVAQLWVLQYLSQFAQLDNHPM